MSESLPPDGAPSDSSNPPWVRLLSNFRGGFIPRSISGLAVHNAEDHNNQPAAAEVDDQPPSIDTAYVNSLLNDRHRATGERVTTLTKYTFELFSGQGGIEASPNDEELDELFSAASTLIKNKNTRIDTRIGKQAISDILEFLDDAIDELGLASVSPLGVAQKIERLRPGFSREAAINTLMAKLWLTTRSDWAEKIDERLPSSFKSAIEYCAEQAAKQDK